MRQLVGKAADALLQLQKICLPPAWTLPRFNQARRLVETSAPRTLDASCGNGTLRSGWDSGG